MTTPLLRPVVLAAFLLATAACAAPQATAGGGSGASVITAEMIERHGGNDTFEIVRSIRPRWLRARGQDSLRSPSVVQVYMDNIRMGGPESLRGVQVTSIREIRWHSATEATQRWGTGHGAGVIQVVTRP
jgi:hypothetical protein